MHANALPMKWDRAVGAPENFGAGFDRPSAADTAGR